MSDMKKQLVWLCGHSAVGKREILNKLIDDESWRSDLGIPDDVVEAGLDLAQVKEKLLDHTAVLVKWQNAKRDLVFEALRTMPDVNHRVIHVHRPAEEHRNGFSDKFPDDSPERFDQDNIINKRHTELYRVDGIDFIDVVALNHFADLVVI